MLCHANVATEMTEFIKHTDENHEKMLRKIQKTFQNENIFAKMGE